MAVSGGFFAELRRRNVIRMAGLYLVGAWLLVQVAGTVLPMFDAPAWLPRSIVILLAIGFIPALVFSWVFELTPEGLKREGQIAPQESITPQTGRRMERAIFVLLALALAYFATDKFLLAPRRDAALLASAQQAANKQAATLSVAHDTSIAVLPLANAGAQDQQFFSDGLSEALIIALSQYDGLKVIGRNSAFRFRDTKDDSTTIGRKLGVDHLLEGSVQHAGDVVRISFELIDAAYGQTQWSQRYDRPYTDLFKLQDEITNAVADALKAKLLANGTASVQNDQPPSGNLGAYNSYLQGNFFRDRNTEVDLRKAIDAYTAATRLDPLYALAWVGLAQAHASVAVQFLGGRAERQALETARRAVEAALKADPQLAAAHIAKSRIVEIADFDWAEAEAEAQRALQLAPNDGAAKHRLGQVLAWQGQPQQAIGLEREALATDPLRPNWYNWLATYALGLGRLDEAEAAERKAIELQPTAVGFHFGLTMVAIVRGDAAAALAAAQEEPPGIWRDYALTFASQIGPDRAAADASLKKMIDQYAAEGAFQIAEVHALRRDADKTFEWLDRAWVNRDAGIAYLLYDPFLLRYKNDPRFAAFCTKIGLPTPAEAAATDRAGIKAP
jgi:TolB-like protein/Flp pilus assembly protein TadD